MKAEGLVHSVPAGRRCEGLGYHRSCWRRRPPLQHLYSAAGGVL